MLCEIIGGIVGSVYEWHNIIMADPKYFKYKGEWLNDIRHRQGV